MTLCKYFVFYVLGSQCFYWVLLHSLKKEIIFFHQVFSFPFNFCMYVKMHLWHYVRVYTFCMLKSIRWSHCVPSLLLNIESSSASLVIMNHCGIWFHNYFLLFLPFFVLWLEIFSEIAIIFCDVLKTVFYIQLNITYIFFISMMSPFMFI